MIKLLHIGLGKCGSTFLQNQIFPQVAKKLRINNISIHNNEFIKIDETNVKFHYLENFKKIEKYLPNNFIISDEGLFAKGWEFSRINLSFNHIRRNFSNDTVILLVIRNPYDLLNSIYCQSIQEMKIVKPKNFFFNDSQEKRIRINNKFNLYNFDYSKLITLYKSYFKKVVVIKYENFENLQFLKKIFNLDDEFINKLNINTKSYNKSISKFGINFILFLDNFFDLKKYDNYLRNNIKVSNNFLVKIKSKFFSQFVLRSFFQNKFDKIISYKKYKFEKKYIPIDIDKEILKYERLKL